MAVDALDFHGGPDFLVKLGVAVAVLDEMAIDAVHAFFEMDIEQVHRNAVGFFHERIVVPLATVVLQELLDLLGHAHGGLELFGGDVLDYVARVIEQMALAVLLVDGAENPAVAVEIGELGVFGLAV